MHINAWPTIRSEFCAHGNVLVVGTDMPEPILYNPVLMGRVGFVTWWDYVVKDGPGPLWHDA